MSIKHFTSHEFPDKPDERTFMELYPNWDTEAGLMKHWTRFAQSHFGESPGL